MARFTHPGIGDGSGTPGPQGPQGEQGIPGETGPAGADGADALWNFTGAYNLGASYAVGDVATYNGETWYRINSNGGNTGDTPAEGTFWTLIAQKGIDGAQGPQGETGATGGFGSRGSFYDIQTQEIIQGQESIGIPVLIRQIDNDATSGFTVLDNSKIKAQNAGTYNFAFSFQFHNDGGGGNGQTVEIWFTKNGTAITDSNTRIAVNTNSPYVVAAWNFFQKLNANDFIQMYWATDNHHIRMKYNTGAMGGPAIPSAIITVNQVG